MMMVQVQEDQVEREGLCIGSRCAPVPPVHWSTAIFPFRDADKTNPGLHSK